MIDGHGSLRFSFIYRFRNCNLITMETPKRGHEALRRGRFSHAFCDYFVTFAVENRRKGLCAEPVYERFREACGEAETDGTCILRCGTLMPDHVHLLFRLGNRLQLGQLIGRLKTKTNSVLRHRGLLWQRRYYDHRMRPEEDRLPVFMYIYLNPYRKGLAGHDEFWPYFWCANDDWEWFQPLLRSDCPYPEWLN
jgi:REP element-mobilizing transposase RayT